MERSDDFRVIRDYASDYANAQQYNYNVLNPQPLSGQMTTPWHKNVDRLGEHAFRNPYEDFGAALTSSPYAAAAVPRSTANTGARIGEDGRNREVRFFAGGRTGRGGGKFQQQQRGQQQMPQRKGAIRRQHTQYPYSPIPNNVEQKSVPVTGNSAFCFHGYQSIFTLQHRFDFIVDGETYKSIDQYYQWQKVKDLTGLLSAKFTDGSTRDYSSLARDLIRQASIRRNDVDNWRTGKGLLVIQKALLEKVRQCYDLRNALISTGDKIIVHTFAGEDFYGSGTPVKYVKDVFSTMEKNKVSLQFPMMFPITDETVKYIPVIGKGKNVLGAIYMILREKINTGKLDGLRVETAESAAKSSASGEPMNVDFTADSNS